MCSSYAEGEAHLPAKHPAPEEDTWLQGSNVDEKRPYCAQAAPRQGAQAPDRRRRAVVAAPDRIRRRPEFERIYSTGAKIHGRLMTVFVMANGTDQPRLGVAATRKLGSAVERNRAKRRARELFQRRREVGGLDIVIVPRREMLDAPFATLEAEYAALLGRRRDRARLASSL